VQKEGRNSQESRLVRNKAVISHWSGPECELVRNSPSTQRWLRRIAPHVQTWLVNSPGRAATSGNLGGKCPTAGPDTVICGALQHEMPQIVNVVASTSPQQNLLPHGQKLVLTRAEATEALSPGHLWRALAALLNLEKLFSERAQCTAGPTCATQQRGNTNLCMQEHHHDACRRRAAARLDPPGVHPRVMHTHGHTPTRFTLGFGRQTTNN